MLHINYKHLFKTKTLHCESNCLNHSETNRKHFNHQKKMKNDSYKKI